MHFKTESAADSSGLIRFFGYNKKNRLDFHEKMCIIGLSRMGYRLMVGQRILIPSVLVRVQVAQPKNTSRLKRRLFLLISYAYKSPVCKGAKNAKILPYTD